MKLDVECKNCKGKFVELREACCEDRARGLEIVKVCSRCGHKEVFLWGRGVNSSLEQSQQRP